MMNKNVTLFLVAAAAFSVSLSFWFADRGAEIEQDGRSVDSIQSRDKAANEQEAPINLGEEATVPNLFGVFEIIDAETLEVTFSTEDLKNSKNLSYLDPLTGESHESKSVRTVINVASKALVSSVEIDGITRPLTITIADNAVFMTLPYAGGVLEGEGSLESMTLRKQQPIKDFIKEDVVQPEILDHEPLQDFPICLNC
jgi:hypothetical protein